jgi:serine protease Do
MTRTWLLWAAVAVAGSSASAADFVNVARDVQTKVTKIYGAGGLSGMEAYQSGIVISADGHVLTVSSYVLDEDEVTVVLDDGRRTEAKVVAVDPLVEVALLKFDAGEEVLPHFDISHVVEAQVGTRVLALSNLFGIATGNEPVSVLQGTVSAVAPLAARRGAYATRFRGDVYVVDAATNNPGAAGGALVDSEGRLLGILGKELRSELTDTWLNYALPVPAFRQVVEQMLADRYEAPPLDEALLPEQPLSLASLGIVTVVDVVARTPPFVDRVVFESAADRAGVRPDDLIVMVDGHVVNSCRDLTEFLSRYESDASLVIGVLRNDQLKQISLQVSAEE